MNIDELVAMAKRIHDAEGYNLGASSTRDYRNQFWARVIGCAHHGHPVYNPTPDPQWHLKNGGGGRPQTDDVATSMPSRAYWDCIANVGADNYRFTASGHAEPLPSNQEVYGPPVPEGHTGSNPGPVEPPPPPPPTGTCRFQPADPSAVMAAVDGLTDEAQGQRQAVAVAIDEARQTKAELANLVARLEQGFVIDANVRYLGALKGTVKLPKD
jgi:hypothetical protein